MNFAKKDNLLKKCKKDLKFSLCCVMICNSVIQKQIKVANFKYFKGMD